MNHLIQYWPNGTLLVSLLIVFTLYFIFGVLKASLNGVRRTSRGLRNSFVKLLQYGGCIIVSAVILNIVYKSGENFGQQFA